MYIILPHVKYSDFSLMCLSVEGRFFENHLNYPGKVRREMETGWIYTYKKK